MRRFQSRNTFPGLDSRAMLFDRFTATRMLLQANSAQEGFGVFIQDKFLQ